MDQVAADLAKKYAIELRKTATAIKKNMVERDLNDIKNLSSNNWKGHSGDLMIQLFKKNMDDIIKIADFINNIAGDIDSVANTCVKTK